MAVFRVHKKDNYTQINNYLIKDNLSLKAKGMMLVLLSLPNNWDFSVSGLSTICKEARNTINGILNELEEKQYLERTRVYEGKQIKEWRYDIYEIPKLLYLKNEDIKNEYLKNVDIKNEYLKNVDIKNDTQLIKDKLNKKELIKDKLNNSSSKEDKTIYDYLEENGFNLTPIQYEVVSTWGDTELTRYAIKQAVLNNKFNIKYIDKIIYSYQKNNITTIQQAIEEEENFKERKVYKHKETPSEQLDRIFKELEEGENAKK